MNTPRQYPPHLPPDHPGWQYPLSHPLHPYNAPNSLPRQWQQPTDAWTRGLTAVQVHVARRARLARLAAVTIVLALVMAALFVAAAEAAGAGQPTSAVVWVHGGAWKGAGTPPPPDVAQLAADHDAALVDVDYCRVPACGQREMLDAIAQAAAGYDQVVLVGQSAGAHLAAQAAFWFGYPAVLHACPCNVWAVPDPHGHVADLAAASPGQPIDPMRVATRPWPHQADLFIMHGASDNIVPRYTTQQFAAEASGHGHQVKWHRLPGGHGWPGLTPWAAHWAGARL